MADLHLQHWPGWEGAIEMRRIAEPDEAPDRVADVDRVVAA